MSKPRITSDGLKEVTRKILAGPRLANGELLYGARNPNYFEAVIFICDLWKNHLKKISKSGGLATREKLTPEQRRQSASHAAQSRWARRLAK